MKHLIFQFVFVLFSFNFCAQTVTPTDAANYEGKTVTVCAKVMGTHITKGEKKVIYLNLEKAYPNNPFTVVIFESGADNFDYNPLEFLKNKNICVFGKISFYKDKPQIIVSKQSQITITK